MSKPGEDEEYRPRGMLAVAGKRIAGDARTRRASGVDGGGRPLTFAEMQVRGSTVTEDSRRDASPAPLVAAAAPPHLPPVRRAWATDFKEEVIGMGTAGSVVLAARATAKRLADKEAKKAGKVSGEDRSAFSRRDLGAGGRS